MKKIINISISFILIFAILFAYIGVPVNKMTCSENGRIVISLTNQKQQCNHQKKNVRDCCKPIKSSKKTCCNYLSSFLHLNEISTIKESQTKTGHLICSINFLQNNFKNNSKKEYSLNTNSLSAPLFHSGYSPKMPEITGNFRI